MNKLIKHLKVTGLITAILCVFARQGVAQSNKDLKGQDMTVYKFIDKQKNPVSIGDLKGKYVFVDVWASWCRACINKFPAYDSLKVALKDKNIVCLQISIDDEEWRWRNGMGYHARVIDQWFSTEGRLFMHELKVAYIPRYILIDREGKVMDPKVEWNDTDQLIRRISKLKGI